MNIKHIFIILLALVSFNKHSQAAQIDSGDDLLEKWFYAARNGELEVVQKLISKVNINAQDIEGTTALLMATIQNRENIVKFLLAHPGIDINVKNENGNNALMCAAKYGRENIIKLLLSRPDKLINAQNNEGDTALHEAMTARIGTAISEETVAKITKLILEVPGIDVNIQNNKKLTALLCTTKFSCLAMAQIMPILLGIPGINFLARDEDGMTAQEIAEKFKYNRFKSAILHLIKKAVSALASTASDAIKIDDLATVKSIVAQIGIDKIVDQEGNTFLDKAFMANRPEIILFLLQNANDPQELLARFPFEFIQPSSDIFRWCMDIAYPDSKKDASKESGSKLKSCAHCTSPFAKATEDGRHFSLEPSTKATQCGCCSKQQCEMLCGRCKKVYYCSASCQKADWKVHKTNCQKS